MPGTVYSERLGAITDAQFDAATRKAGLGRFLAARQTSTGLFGQNVFLTTTEGEFVFRGAPHWRRTGSAVEFSPDDAWQFPKEQLYARLLHECTDVPVAWPQIRDDSCETFPWPYLLTPRLAGLCLGDPADRAGLTRADFVVVADALGEALAGLQHLTSDFAGDFDSTAQAIVPFKGGYGAHLAEEVGRHAADARRNGRFDAGDDAFLEGLISADRVAGDAGHAVYIHNDFSLGNVLVERAGDGWRVSGVIDLMTSTFGDPAADFSRLVCNWLDRDNPACIEALIAGYRREGGMVDPSPARLDLLTAYERLMIWAYYTRPEIDHEAMRGKTFRDFMAPYIAGMRRYWYG